MIGVSFSLPASLVFCLFVYVFFPPPEFDSLASLSFCSFSSPLELATSADKGFCRWLSGFTAKSFYERDDVHSIYHASENLKWRRGDGGKGEGCVVWGRGSKEWGVKCGDGEVRNGVWGVGCGTLKFEN